LGGARLGHPEDTIRAHIAEIEPNLEILRAKLTAEDYWKLKLLIHTQDSSKGEAQPGAPITDPKSHASLARAFLATHCEDADLHDWNLFPAFSIVDGCTAGKSREPLHWLFREIAGKVESQITGGHYSVMALQAILEFSLPVK